MATLSSGSQELSQHREIVAKDIWKYGLEGGCVGNPGFKVLAELGMLHQYSPRSFRPSTRHDLCKRTPLHEHGSDLHRRVQRRPLEKGMSLDMPTRDTTLPAISLGLNPKRGGSLYIRLRELSQPRLCTRWNHTPILQRGLSRIRVLSPPRSSLSEAIVRSFSASSVSPLPCPSWVRQVGSPWSDVGSDASHPCGSGMFVTWIPIFV